MKKPLLIVAVVGTLLVTGCFDEDKKPEPKPIRLELKQLMELPGVAHSGPLGLTLSDDGTLISTGLGDVITKRNKSGTIYTAAPQSSNLVERSIDSGAGEDYYGFSSAVYSKKLNSLFVCSVPLLSFGAIAPTVVEFKLDSGTGHYVWTSVMNFNGAQPSQLCKGMAIQNNNLLVVNMVAINDSYPVLYRVDLRNPLPATMPVSILYRDLGYTASEMLAESVVDIAPEMEEYSEAKNPGDFHVYLLDRSRRSIDEVIFRNASGSISVTEANFDIKIIRDPLSFINIDYRKFILSGGAHSHSPTALYEIYYPDGFHPIYSFLALAPSQISSFAYGQSRSGSGNSLYAALTSADEKGKFHVAEYSYNGQSYRD
ncbi:hypothetical protein [Candidatus Ichthyocystis hellenicum]|uniref:hypothetical protein n=1 Tax=Candidatus Ichthyocystis hellenicum TaxID=1561003 RepID=UPI000B8108F0|nr:hypothetical protein [Candidatus Ichthyocystis hellenicum]